jgi:hypothetical protein
MSTLDDLQLVEKEEDAVMSSEKPLFEARELGSTPGPGEALFEAREPGTPLTDGDAAGKKKYAGPERRRENRRKQTDRRGEVRFDASSNDRRQSQGRREDDKVPRFW